MRIINSHASPPLQLPPACIAKNVLEFTVIRPNNNVTMSGTFEFTLYLTNPNLVIAPDENSWVAFLIRGGYTLFQNAAVGWTVVPQLQVISRLKSWSCGLT
jgi:hypothetical protein